MGPSTVNALHPGVLGIEPIAQYSAALADIAASGDLGRPVPTCGEWTMADLVHHLYEVQRFWVSMLDRRPAAPDDYAPPERVADDALVDQLRSVSATLIERLGGVDPAEPMWSWSREQTVGFTVRRQTHESLIHALDAAMAAGVDLGPTPAERWADGVDEMLRVFRAVGDHDPFRPTGGGVVAHATDTGDVWMVRFGHTIAEGTEHDALQVTLGAEGREAEQQAMTETDGVITGTAETLDRWLWGRSDGAAVDLGARPERAAELQRILSQVTG